MTEVINPLLPNNLLTQLPENLTYLQITDLSQEVAVQLKVGETALLDITENLIGGFSTVLKISGRELSITLPENIVQTLSSVKQKDIPVRIGTGGRLFPLVEEPSMPKTVPVIDTTVSPQNVLQKVEIAPLKIQNFVTGILEQSKISQDIVKQIVEWVAPLNISLVKVGGNDVTNNMVNIVQNILEQIIKEPQNFEQYKLQLQQAVASLGGTQISGRISERVNDLTVIQTPLGKTFFNSKLKLPVSENVLLNIGLPVSDLPSEIRFVDDLFKILLPIQKKTVSTKEVFKLPQMESLSKLNNLKPEIMPVIIKSLPVDGEHILENIYRFYQAASAKDVRQWLGGKAVAEIMSDNITSKTVIKELDAFLANAVKETPVWKIVEMPLFDGTNFSSIKIAVKKDAEKEQQQYKSLKNGTRFIVETDFSKLGSFQFDGFSNVEKRSLDLIIRTANQLDDDFCSNIINLFKKSLYSLDYIGTVKISRQQTFISLHDETQINKGIYV